MSAKPHIWISADGGYWLCSILSANSTRIGKGSTPCIAYADWIAKGAPK